MKSPANDFERDGYYLAPPAVPLELIQRAIPHMDAVMRGEFETGIAPMDFRTADHDTSKLVKIDQAHSSDRTIYELITHPAIGEWAAKVTGGKWIQVWVSQLLYKPTGGSLGGSVGWHQDWQYWKDWWVDGSEVFTAWLALSDVQADCGPMLFVHQSHRWGFLDKGDFWGNKHTVTPETIQPPTGSAWTEVPTILKPGAMSFHHRFTYHGSGPNLSKAPRRGFALHLRTEKSKPASLDNNPYTPHLDNPEICPVIFGG